MDDCEEYDELQVAAKEFEFLACVARDWAELHCRLPLYPIMETSWKINIVSSQDRLQLSVCGSLPISCLYLELSCGFGINVASLLLYDELDRKLELGRKVEDYELDERSVIYVYTEPQLKLFSQ